MNKNFFLLTITALTLIAISASAKGDKLTKKSDNKDGVIEESINSSSNEVQSTSDKISNVKTPENEDDESSEGEDKKSSTDTDNNNPPKGSNPGSPDDKDPKVNKAGNQPQDVNTEKGIFAKIQKTLSPFENFAKFQKLSFWKQTGTALGVVGISGVVIYYLWQKNNNKNMQEEESSDLN